MKMGGVEDPVEIRRHSPPVCCVWKKERRRTGERGNLRIFRSRGGASKRLPTDTEEENRTLQVQLAWLKAWACGS